MLATDWLSVFIGLHSVMFLLPMAGEIDDANAMMPNMVIEYAHNKMIHACYSVSQIYKIFWQPCSLSWLCMVLSFYFSP